MSSGVVAVSFLDGSAGEEIGRAVAQRLRLRLVDYEIIRDAARAHGVDAEAVADAEKRRGLFTRFVEELGRAGPEAAGVAPPVFGTPTSQDYRGFLRDAVRATADEGAVVIVAHAASMALADRPEVLRVFITASVDTRIARLVERGLGDERQARKAIKDADADRADYLRGFYGVDPESPTHYDLVVNTDRITSAQAADIVVGAVASRRTP